MTSGLSRIAVAFAASNVFRLLEGWLRVPLFERHDRQVIPTLAARACLAKIGPALDQIASATAGYGSKTKAVLRINGPATFVLRWLVPRLATFQEQHPNVKIKLETSNGSLEALQDFYDIIIRGGPDAFDGYSFPPSCRKSGYRSVAQLSSPGCRFERSTI